MSKRSPEWNAAHVQAMENAEQGSEAEFIRLLALPIPTQDRRAIELRVGALKKRVSDTPIAQLRKLEGKLSDNRQGLGRLFELELSTGLRARLLSDIRKRLSRDDAGLSDKTRGLERPGRASPREATPQQDEPALSQMSAQAPQTPEIFMSYGAIDAALPEDESPGVVVIPITTTFPDIEAAKAIILDPLQQEIAQLLPRAVVKGHFKPVSGGGFKLKVRVENADSFIVMAALGAVQGRYFTSLANVRISEEELAQLEESRAYARLAAKLGNMINPIPFTEFTEEGFEMTSSPTAALPAVKGLKGIKNLKGKGQITRRTLKPMAAGIEKLRALKKLFHRGVNKKAWANARDQLSLKDQLLLRQLEQAHTQALNLIKAGKRAEAYSLVKSWRAHARALYDKVRDNYWQDAGVRKAWKENGADMAQPAPKLRMLRIEGERRFQEIQTVTLEHKARLNDNPFLACSASNIAMSLAYENSVMLETMRRIERGMRTVWSNGPVEQMVRSIEAGLEKP